MVNLKNKRKNAAGKLVFLAAVICLALFLLRDSWDHILREVLQTPVQMILIAVVCSFLYNCFDGCALARLFRTTQKDFSYRDGIGCSLYYSFYRTLTLGNGTVPAGMYYVGKKGIPAERSLEVFTINYIIQRITICLYFVSGFLLHWSQMKDLYRDYTVYIIIGILITVLVAAALIIVCVCESLHRVIFMGIRAGVRKYEKKQAEKTQQNESGSKKKKRAGKKRNTERWKELTDEWENKAVIIRREAKRLLTSPKLLTEVFLLTVGKLTMWYMIPAFLYGMTKPAELTLVTAVSAMSAALAGVIPTPGGVGAVEAVFYLLFTPLVGNVSAASGMLIYRFATFLLPVVFGLPVQISMVIKEK